MPTATSPDQVQVRFSKELFNQLEALAKDEGISLGQALVKAIGVAEYLNRVRTETPGTKILIDRKGKLTELELGPR